MRRVKGARVFPAEGIRLNPNSPLANRLVAGWVPSAASGIIGRGKGAGIVRDLVHGNHAAILDLDFQSNPVFGRGLYCDGTTGDWAQAPVLHTDYLTAGFISLAAWIHTGTLGTATRQIFTNDGYPGQTRCWQFRVVNKKLHAHFWNSAAANSDTTGASTLADNTTYFVAATWDGAVVRLYVNGIQDAQSNFAGTAAATPQTVPWIGEGKAPYITGPWNGAIGPCLWWKRWLSPQEIWTLWNPLTRWSLFSVPMPLARLSSGGAPPAGRRRSWAAIIGG